MGAITVGIAAEGAAGQPVKSVMAEGLPIPRAGERARGDGCNGLSPNKVGYCLAALNCPRVEVIHESSHPHRVSDELAQDVG